MNIYELNDTTKIKIVAAFLSILATVGLMAACAPGDTRTFDKVVYVTK